MYCVIRFRNVPPDEPALQKYVKYKYGCAGERSFRLGGMQMLLWRAIEEAKESCLQSREGKRVGLLSKSPLPIADLFSSSEPFCLECAGNLGYKKARQKPRCVSRFDCLEGCYV
jgi:hypothetical protein